MCVKFKALSHLRYLQYSVLHSSVTVRSKSGCTLASGGRCFIHVTSFNKSRLIRTQIGRKHVTRIIMLVYFAPSASTTSASGRIDSLSASKHHTCSYFRRWTACNHHAAMDVVMYQKKSNPLAGYYIALRYTCSQNLKQYFCHI